MVVVGGVGEAVVVGAGGEVVVVGAGGEAVVAGVGEAAALGHGVLVHVPHLPTAIILT